MSQQEQDITQLCRDVMKNGLLLTERTEELVSNYEGPVVEDKMVEVMQEMLSNSQDKMRQRRIIMLSANIGQRLGSETVVQFAQDAQAEWEGKYGKVDDGR